MGGERGRGGGNFLLALFGGPPRGDGPVSGCLPVARQRLFQSAIFVRVRLATRRQALGVVATPHGVLPRDSH